MENLINFPKLISSRPQEINVTSNLFISEFFNFYTIYSLRDKRGILILGNKSLPNLSIPRKIIIQILRSQLTGNVVLPSTSDDNKINTTTGTFLVTWTIEFPLRWNEISRIHEGTDVSLKSLGARIGMLISANLRPVEQWRRRSYLRMNQSLRTFTTFILFLRLFFQRVSPMCHRLNSDRVAGEWLIVWEFDCYEESGLGSWSRRRF